jgi:LuxR family maltose regulon positive regulatory protein
LILAARLDEARALITGIELALGDLPAAIVDRYHVSVELLRAACFAFQDNASNALPIALSSLSRNATGVDHQLATTLCRFAFWQLGESDALCAPLRPKLAPGSGRRSSIAATFDLAIDAAIELDRLHLATAKRLANDALDLAAASGRRANGPGALAACVAAQVLYEEGNLDDAETLLRDWLPVIRSQSCVECALRAYLVLTRIAIYRAKPDFADLLLQEAETLGTHRGWPRLVAASLAERAWLLLQLGCTDEARHCAERLGRHAQACQTGSGRYRCHVERYRALTASRITLAGQPTGEALAGLRLLYHQALDRMDRYEGCRLAVELAVQLAAIDECTQADALFLQTLSVGSAVGLYQVFVDGDRRVGSLLKRAYELANQPDLPHRAVLPYVGGLFARWGAREVQCAPAKPTGKSASALSARERDVLKLIGSGQSNKRIALALDISPETVKSHVKRIFVKLAVGTRVEAVTRAGALGLL